VKKSGGFSREIPPSIKNRTKRTLLLTLCTSLALLACYKEQSASHPSSPSSSELGSSEMLASCSFRYATKARLARNSSYYFFFFVFFVFFFGLQDTVQQLFIQQLSFITAAMPIRI
jgi:hypothetical protein